MKLCSIIRKILCRTPLGNKYLTDAAFKTEIMLFFSFVMNILVASANVVSVFLYNTFWFGVLATYYFILGIMRLLLLRYLRHKEIGDSFLGELKISRICGIILLNLNFVLVGAILMILFDDKGFNYQGIFIYILAGYTFYMVTHAIKDLIEFRKFNSPIMTFSRILTLSAALVSFLALETAIFAQFGNNMSVKSQKIAIAITGFCVCLVVIALALYVIINYTKTINSIIKRKEIK